VALIALGSCSSIFSPQQSIDRSVDVDIQTGRNIRYVTRDAMHLANEQWLLYSCELPAGQTDIGSDFNTDSYWYSRYNLGNLLFRSGMGIHLVHNPLFKQHVANDRKPDGSKMWAMPPDFMHFKIRQFCARTGVPCRLDREHMNDPKAFPPKGAFPIFLEFGSGVPRFTQPPVLNDFSTLRWDPATIDKTLYTAALGQTLVKQVLWCEDFFAYHRTGPNGEVWFGNDKEYGNGFRGAALTAEAITKMFTLKSSLAYNPDSGEFGGVDPMTYNPAKGLRYFPHSIWPEMMSKPGMPPMPVSFEVVDDSSHLFDQASLLWGTSEFYFYSDPTVKDSFDAIFGDQGDHKTHGALFPATPHMLSKGLSAVIFKNLMAMHFDMKYGTFHSVASSDGDRSGNITTVDAGMVLVALVNLQSRLHDAPAPLLENARKAINAQARFLKDRMMTPEGGFYNGFDIGDGPDRSTPLLESQGMGIRGLLAAYSVTKDPSLKEAAEKAYGFMNRELWSDSAKTYRSEVGAHVSVFTPRNVAATLGGLRELALASFGDKRKEIVSRLDKFFATVETNHGQQLAEIDPTGEPIPPMAQIKKMQAQLMQMMKTNPDKAKAMKMQMADVDRDGIPKPGMAGGKFGFAPVPASSVKITTR